MVIAAALLSACSITKKYERPAALSTDKLYRDEASADTTTIADMPWQSVFKDEKLNALIQKGLGGVCEKTPALHMGSLPYALK